MDVEVVVGEDDGGAFGEGKMKGAHVGVGNEGKRGAYVVGGR